ncbi:hypothetical protein LUZ60_007051 [Juncus effusus]|nr:hypothetical protein LUZ60_007051 [Juncus effusus]
MIQDSSFKSSDSNKMVDFLEEVKERLRLEIEEKSQRNSTSNKQKDGQNEINNSTNPKQIARDIAKQIRENVTREMDKKLTRSQPFKLQNFEPDSSNLTRDTRQILSERLKNVLRNETGTERPKTSLTGTSTGTEPSRASFLIKRRERVKSMSEFPNIVNIENDENETRFKLDSIESINAGVASPRSLVRSFSAPISGTNLGKLLLEDLNSNSDQYEKNEMEVRSRKEHRFGLRGRVSNLRGKLFGKKTESVKRINTVDFYPLKLIKTIPSALVNCANNQENFTEIPPSPASISSSSHNEFSVIENNNSSPVSPLEVSSHASRNSFGDLSFKFQGASPSPAKQVEKEESQEIIFTEQYENNEIIEILSPEQAYVKEILVTAGLYENKNDFAPRSLYFQIFTEMEETYSKHRKDCTDQEPQEMNPDILIDRKLLFDLANESMEALYGPLRNSGTLSEWVGTSGGLPSGRILLDEIWNQMIIFSDPPMDEMQTIDNMVGRDVKMDSWTSELYEEKDVLCKRVTFVIFAELMDDFLQEMGCISE